MMCNVIWSRASNALCDKTTALGEPDVPDVKMMSAVSSSFLESFCVGCVGASLVISIAHSPVTNSAGILEASFGSAKTRAS